MVKHPESKFAPAGLSLEMQESHRPKQARTTLARAGRRAVMPPPVANILTCPRITASKVPRPVLGPSPSAAISMPRTGIVAAVSQQGLGFAHERHAEHGLARDINGLLHNRAGLRNDTRVLSSCL